MLSLSASTQVFLVLGATNMRKGFDGLSELVMNQLHGDPLSTNHGRSTYPWMRGQFL